MTEVFENADVNNPSDTNRTDVNGTNETRSDVNHASDLWHYMTKQENEKAKCTICNTILSRRNGATSGLRKHLSHVHKIELSGTVPERSRPKPNLISPDEKKKLDSLIIDCIIQDGRGFDDMRRPGILKVFNHLRPTYTPPHRNTVVRRLKRLQSDHKSLLIRKLSKVNSLGVTCDFWSDKRLYSYVCLTGHFMTSKNKFTSTILSFSWFHHRHTSSNISMVINKELKELNVLEKTRSITTDGASNMSKIGETLGDGTKQIWCQYIFVNGPFDYAAVVGVGHRFHLVVCNGLGLWIRKQPQSSSSNIPNASKSFSSTAPTTSKSSSSVASTTPKSSSSAASTTPKSSSSGTSEPSNVDWNDIDSDEEDYTDDLILNSRSSSQENSSNSTGSFDQSVNTFNDSLNDDNDRNMTTNEDFMDESPDDLSSDIVDNWSVGVIEEFDASTNAAIQQNIGNVMKKCRSMVKLINKSSILMNYVLVLKKQFGINRSLQLDCKSRWSSTHDLIEVMVKYKRIVLKINSEKHDIGLNIKQTNKISSIELDQYDWKLLEVLEKILAPFANATDLISGSQYPTLGLAYFTVIQMRDFLEDTSNLPPNEVKMFIHLRELLSEQIEKYFVDDSEQWDMMKVTIVLLVSSGKNFLYVKKYAYFDPIGYGCLTRRERRVIETNLMDIHEQYVNQKVHQDDVNEIQSTSNEKQNGKQSTTSSMFKFLTSLGKKTSPSSSDVRTTTRSQFNEEMIAYRSLAQKEFNSIFDAEKEYDVMGFWQEHRNEMKTLAKIASDYLISPATSVPSESAFSTASYLLRKQRSRLTPNNLCYSMFLKDKIAENDDMDV